MTNMNGDRYKSIKVYDDSYLTFRKLALVEGFITLTEYFAFLMDERTKFLAERGKLADPNITIHRHRGAS